ncbi:MAG: hypothetical protein Q4A09_06130 [Capnocytophaga felis]|nr:hypothetical protein [Capnocytophaga felis]
MMKRINTQYRSSEAVYVEDFVAFYNNQPIDFEYWEEVTQEFKEEN